MERRGQENEFDFERVIKIISALSFSVGIVIYSFTIGYFHRLEIPTVPAFFDAVSFYLTSSLNTLYNTPKVGFGVLFMGTIPFLTGFVIKRDFSIFLKALYLVISLILFIVPFYYMRKQISLFLPVILATVLGTVFFFYIESNSVTRWNKINALVAYLVFTGFFSLWAFATLDLSFFDKSKLNTYFPNGFGLKPYEPSNLIWVEGGKRYWYSCQPSRGVIYGTNDQENIFVRTEMSDSLRDHLCVAGGE